MDTAPHLTPVLGRYFLRDWSHGEGHRLYDTDGKAYLDFANGIAVTALGHAHPRVTAAIHAQVDKLIGPINGDRLHRADLAPRRRPRRDVPGAARLGDVPQLRLGGHRRRAQAGAPGDRPARDHRLPRRVPRADLRAPCRVTTSALNYRTGYEPALPGVYLTPFPAVYATSTATRRARSSLAWRRCATLFATEIPPSAVAGILIEPVQGEGGFNPAPAAFLRELRAICDQHGILLIADEVQSGYGRTGRMWAFEHAGIVPDVVVVAKVDRQRAAALGDRVVARAPGALGPRRARLDVRRQPGRLRGRGRGARDDPDEGLVENAVARGAELRPASGGSRPRTTASATSAGPGLMIGVEFVRDRATREPDATLPDRLIAACADAGLLVLTCGRSHEVVRWIPPLDVTAAEIAEAVEIFGETLAAIPRD